MARGGAPRGDGPGEDVLNVVAVSAHEPKAGDVAPGVDAEYAVRGGDGFLRWQPSLLGGR
jgi:hypothetical protein